MNERWMPKNCFRILLAVIMCCFMVVASLTLVPVDVSAEYSEEEKAQAKAWLSSHGYAPTQAGASQAYQDYLNGKFDGDPEVEGILGKRVTQTEATTAQEESDDESDESIKNKDKLTTEAVEYNKSATMTLTTENLSVTTEEIVTTKSSTADLTTTESRVSQIEKKVEKAQEKRHNTKVVYVILGLCVLGLVGVLLKIGKDLK